MGSEVLSDALEGVIGEAMGPYSLRTGFDPSRDDDVRLPSTLARFRRALSDRRDAVLSWLGARASHAVPPIVHELDAALEQIDDGTFGDCCECAGKVESSRLELDFKASVCLEHYSERELSELQRDLEWVGEVQRDLAPAQPPEMPGFDLAALSRPAREVSGDDVEFFRWRDGAHGIAVADVMGKGLPAGLLVAHLQSALRLLGPEYDAPDALAARLNEVFRYHLNTISFFTVFLGSLEVETGTLTWCNAGHEPPLVLRAADGAVERLDPTGPAVGLDPAGAWTSGRTTLGTGDRVLVYSDGLVEGANADGEVFGDTRLVELVRAAHGTPAQLVNDLRRQLDEHTGGARQDDLTLVALARS